jgi:uncharacterized protein YbbK (DUF523 family)
MNILVSACLLGEKCRYDGGGNMEGKLAEALKGHALIPVCPEKLGGLPIPRPPSEIKGGRVVSKTGEDVTEDFRRGAEETLKIALENGCTLAILKERSPSCGYGKIYDGTFTGQLIEGNGILAELLAKEGIQIFGESSLDELLDKPEK